MPIADVLPKLRADRGLTQEELAHRLYVTRQAVSRWERGETTPNIDMVKLIARELDVPVTCLIEAPGPFCQSCGMPLTPETLGTESDGSQTEEYCAHCYHNGSFTHEASMDDFIESCAPFSVSNGSMTLDEAVSFLGALLPELKRWKKKKEATTRGWVSELLEASQSVGGFNLELPNHHPVNSNERTLGI